MNDEFPVGRTVTSMERAKSGNDEQLTLTFDDGMTLIVKSWDYEGYQSGLAVVTLHAEEKAAV